MGNAAYRQTTAMANPNMDQDLKTFMQSDLPKFVWQDKIGNGKFMKSYLMKVESTPLVVKVYMKLADEDLNAAAMKLTAQWKVLSPTKFPSLMPYQLWIKSTARVKTPNLPVYLVRQYFHSNLYDRLSTRPFLNELEKYWLIFQLLKCLEICHENRVVHGDLKPENIMCTTSNWVILTDFAPFKPVLLPDDDPTDFQFYFDTMARHKCYLPPERFYRRDVKATPTDAQSTRGLNKPTRPGTGNRAADTDKQPSLHPSMDVFSLGCVIAEILLDGTPLFDFPSMLQYLFSTAEGLGLATKEEDNTVSPLKLEGDEILSKQLLSRIKNPLIRAVIIDMTQRDPERRLSVSEYLKVLFGNVEKFADSYGATSSNDFRGGNPKFSPFPAYFETCLYQLYLKLHWNGVTPDARIAIICESYDHIMEKITGIPDVDGTAFFKLSVENSFRLLSSALAMDSKNRESLLLSGISQNLNAIDVPEGLFANMKKSKLEKARQGELGNFLWENFGKDAKSAEGGFVPKFSANSFEEAMRDTQNFLMDLEGSWEGKEVDPVKVELAETNKVSFLSKMLSSPKTKEFFFANRDSSGKRAVFEGLVLIIDLLCANYRHLKYLTSRITAIMMIGRIGRLCVDSVILQRLIPLLLYALEDNYCLVKITALRTITSLLELVEEFDPIEVNFFPQYLFPNLGRIGRDSELVVRIAFAECMGSLALTAKSFLDRGHALFMRKAISDALANNLDINKIAIEFPYDQKLELLKDQVARWIRDLVIDVQNPVSQGKTKNSASNDSAVKKIILQHIMELCAFFGQESTMEKLLTQLLTFPNDQDWELRCSFCMKIPTVAAFLGTTVTSEYIVPCLENTIYDVEEKVSLSTILAITSLIQLRLISKYLVIDFAQKCKALLIHPSKAIRKATIYLFVVSSQVIGDCSTAVFLLPEIAPILKHQLVPSSLSVDNLTRVIAPPLSREQIRQALWLKLKEQAMQPGSSVSLNELLYSAVNPIEPLSIQDEQDERLQFTAGYLDSSAREIFNKSLRWRAILKGSQELSSYRSTSGYLSPAISTRLAPQITSSKYLEANSLVWTALPSLENSVFCFQIPQIRSVTFIGDDLRRKDIYLDLDEPKNQQKIKYFFMGNIAKESALVLNSPEPTDETNQVNNFGSPLPAKGNSALYPDATNSVYTHNSRSASLAINSVSLLRRLKSLNIPPLPVEMGTLLPTVEEKLNDANDPSNYQDSVSQKSSWKPKEGVLLLTLREHKSAVNRLVVSPDQTYFASASSDRTVKIWQSRQLDRLSFPRSSAMYDRHGGPVVDCVAIDNTHSIASASKDGSVHVWRVDLQTPKPSPEYNNGEVPNVPVRSTATVSGTSMIRNIESAEGEILSVHHFNSDVASVVTFATQRGGVHGWDLRMPQECFRYQIRPELGYITAMSIGPDKNWMCVGTSKGYLSLWDVRYNVVSQAWKHSSCGPINRLASCKAIRANSSYQNLSGLPPTDGAYIFVAAGENEAAVFGLPEAGECLKCFRSLSLDDNKAPIAPLPQLDPISLPRHPYAPFPASFLTPDTSVRHGGAVVKAMIGRISPVNASYLITAGTDRHIRFWDFRSPEACYTVAGLEATQLKSIYRKLDDKSKLFVCYTATIPSSDKILQSHLPMREGRGLTAPSSNFKDSILDLKDIDYPMKFLLSSSRDGEIKIWR